MTDSLEIHNPRPSATKCRLAVGNHQNVSHFWEDPHS